jgi:hypothetical protein
LTLSGIALSNGGEGAARSVGIDGEVKGVAYEYAGGTSCSASEARSDGVVVGKGALTAADEAEEQVGVHLTGDEFLPRVEAESYGATLSGAGLANFATNLGTLKYAGTTLDGVAANATSQLSLQPKYGECEVTSGGTKYVASVKMNGCHYVLGVKNAAPPYVGTWGVACEKESEAIEFKLTKNANNCLKLYPQQGLEGIALSNTGEGPGRSVGIDAEIKGAKYEWIGVCGKGEVRTDGVFAGKSTLLGKDEGGAQIGAWLSGHS